MAQVNSSFSQRSEGWWVGAFPTGYEEAPEIPIKALESSFQSMELQGPYKSEAELRQKLKGISFRTPFMGIYLLYSKNGEVELKSIFRASGPDLAESSWEPINIQQ